MLKLNNVVKTVRNMIPLDLTLTRSENSHFRESSEHLTVSEALSECTVGSFNV